MLCGANTQLLCSADTQVASGYQSLALGAYNTGAGSYSAAVGYNNNVNGSSYHSGAFGYDNTVTNSSISNNNIINFLINTACIQPLR